jgi:Protein of unknown function (DUF2891)
MKQMILFVLVAFTQLLYAQTNQLTKKLPDGRLTLSDKGVSYFANLSLACATRVYPHYYNHERLKSAEDLKPPDKMWPSFYGCYDWHSGVHNHWALVKLLKTYPQAPEAAAIKKKLEESFKAENIQQEINYLKTHQEEAFEYPYGTAWLLKLATELSTWNNPDAKRWLTNLRPLSDYIVQQFSTIIPLTRKARYSGDHYATSIGLSFSFDYAREMKIDSLLEKIKTAGKAYYQKIENFPLGEEPFDYDFMSAGLLITDFMGRILPQQEYENWLKNFCPDLFTVSGLDKALAIVKMEKHDEYEAHFDGFHLNRIWCINSMLKYVSPNFVKPEIKNIWIQKQNEMWEYAQSSIGKGNYDIDHWLSSFSVFALEGNK